MKERLSTSSDLQSDALATPQEYRGTEPLEETRDDFNLFYPDDAAKRKKPPTTADIEKMVEQGDDDEETMLHNISPRVRIPFWHKVKDAVWPSYLINHIFDYPSFRVVFRTWAASFVGTILMAVVPLLKWQGSAAFMLHITVFLNPPGGGLIIWVFLSLVLMCAYCCYVWAHIIIAQAISQAIKGWKPKEYYIQLAIERGVCSASMAKQELSNCITNYTYTGAYLDARQTVIFVIATVFALVGIRLSEPIHVLCKLGKVMATIMIAVLFCYTIFIPYWDPNSIAKTIFKPMGLMFVINTICAFIFFPETLNFQYFKSQSEVLQGLRAASANNLRLVQTLKPSEDSFVNYAHLAKDVIGLRGKLAMLEVQASVIPFEISYGRFDRGDVGEVRLAVNVVISSLAGFEFFYGLFEERKEFTRNHFGGRRSSVATADSKLYSTMDDYKKAGGFEASVRRRQIQKRMNDISPNHQVTLADLDLIAKFITDNLTPILVTADTALELAAKWLNDANHFRIYSRLHGWKKKVALQQENAARIVKCRQEIEEALKQHEAQHEYFQELLEATNVGDEALLCMINQLSSFLQSTKQLCKALFYMLLVFEGIDQTRPTPKVITYLTRPKHDPATHLFRNHVTVEEEYPLEFTSRVQQRDPDNYPPVNNFQRFWKFAINFYKKYILSKRLWTCIYGALFVIASASPFFFRNSAGYYFKEKILWVVVMTGLSLTDNTGVTWYNFGAKVSYSVVGCITGMVMWYICCGNSFGFAAVCGVVFAFLLYYRHFSKHELIIPALLWPVTASLVLGASWVDYHGNLLANIGWGWRPFVIRLICVVVGLVLAALLSLFPTPLLSKVMLRNILSKTVDDFGNLQCLVAKFAENRARDPTVVIKKRHDFVTQKLRQVLLRLLRSQQLTIGLQHELPLIGYWPDSKYKRLTKLITEIVLLYNLIYQLFGEFDDPEKMIPTAFKRLGWDLTDFLANLFAIVQMCAEALHDGGALPRVTQATLALKHMELLLDQWGTRQLSYSERWYNDPEMTPDEEESREDSIIQKMPSAMKNFDYSRFFSHDGQCAINILLYGHIMYSAYDEMVSIIKSLVGEKYDYSENLLFSGDDLSSFHAKVQ